MPIHLASPPKGEHNRRKSPAPRHVCTYVRTLTSPEGDSGQPQHPLPNANSTLSSSALSTTPSQLMSSAKLLPV